MKTRGDGESAGVSSRTTPMERHVPTGEPAQLALPAGRSSKQRALDPAEPTSAEHVVANVGGEADRPQAARELSLPSLTETRAYPLETPKPQRDRRRLPRRTEGESALPGARPKGGIRRVPALDGIRGIAVMVVVIYHLFGTVLRGGYLGVDMFFVLSGFLITSLLAREKLTTGRIVLRKFWLRRARRILPAAVVVLLVTTAVGGPLAGDSAVALPRQFFTTLFFVNNWGQIAASSSYFAESGTELCAHYWSLAVEEQFYVLWPFLIFVLLWQAGRSSGGTSDDDASRLRRAAVITGALGAASFALMVTLYHPAEDPSRVYYGTDTHSFGLLVGAIVALLLCNPSREADSDSWPSRTGATRRMLRLSGAVGLLGILVLCIFLPDTSPVTYRGGLLLASLATAGIIAAVVQGSEVLCAVLSVAPLRRLGELSFSLYLWHWPVMIVAEQVVRRESPGWMTSLAALVISLVLSEASYRWVETPFRRRGFRPVFAACFSTSARPMCRLSAGVGAAVLAGAAAVGMCVAPDMTRLERDLRAAASTHSEAQQAEPAPEPEREDEREMPSGSEITAIGDSVMLASKDALEHEFPGIYVDGAVSRHWEEGEPIAQQMAAAGTLDRFVVLGFGTNGPATGAGDPELLGRFLDELGEDRVVILVLPYGDRAYMPEAEKEVREEAERRENVYVADWCHAVRDDTSLLRDDLIHPTPPGALAYAAAIRGALEQWVNDDEHVPPVCGV